MRVLVPSNCERIAVAVSGGADSMALAHVLSQTGLPVHAITVDHALRAESATEAAQVANWVSAWGLTHTVLRWDGEKPETGRMESARAARYALMAAECRARGITHLAVAHHADDQAETFFMRLSRGSGIDGLAAMRECTAYDENLTLWRPLLNQASHDDLVAYCRDHDIGWIEDPSNTNTNYTRNRLRAALKNEGLTEKRLNTTMRRLERASDALRVLADRLLEKALRDEDGNAWVLDLKILRDEPFELVVRVLRRAIDTLGASGDYGARYERVEELAQACLSAPAAYAATLGGCVLRVHPRRQTLVVTRESTGVITQEIIEKTAKSLPLSANGL